MGCADCSADSHGYSKEPACRLQPGDSSQPGTPSSQEPSPSEHPLSPLHPSRGPLYPSNHDRMRAALKKPVVPLDGKGNGALSSEGYQSGWGGGGGCGQADVASPFSPPRGILLDSSAAV